MKNNRIKNLFTKKVFSIIIVFIGISTILSSPNIFVILLSISLLYKLFYPKINKNIFTSNILIITLITFGYFSLLQCVILVSWIFNKNFPLDCTPVFLMIIILVMFLYKNPIKNKKPVDSSLDLKTKLFCFQDAIAFSISLIICAVVFIAPIRESSGDIIPTLTLSLVNGNVDDAVHLAMVNDHIQFNRGVLFGSDAIVNTRSQGFYPTGWHSITAIITKAVYPNIKVGAESLLAYGLQKLFWFFVLFYLLIRSTFIFCRNVNPKKLKTSSIFFISSFSTLIGCMLFIPLLREGFYSFIPQLITAILTLMLLTQINIDEQDGQRRSLPLLFIIGIGGCLSWLLPLPAFTLTVLLVTFSLVKNKKIKIIFKNIFQILKENIIILSIIASAVIVQLYVMLKNNSSESVSLSKGLTLNGGIVVYSLIFQIIICVGFVSYLFNCNKRNKNSFNSPLSLILSLILFCSLIGLIQVAHTGKVDYYFYKILDILIVSVLPLCIIGINTLLDKINQSNHILVSTVFVSGAFLLLLPEISIFPYSAGYRHLSNGVDNSLYFELKNNISEDNYFNKKIIFYYLPGSNNYFGNEVANYLAKSNEMDGTCFYEVKNTIWDSPDINTLIEKINNECGDYTVSIITDYDNYVKFNDTISSENLNNAKITIKHY